jgi:hypothetical protein
MSRTAVNGQFRFLDFLGSVEGQVWRAEPAITPFVVSLGPNASNASTPTLHRDPHATVKSD